MFYIDSVNGELMGHIVEIVKPKKPENSLHVFALKNIKDIPNLEEYLNIKTVTDMNSRNDVN